MGVVDVATDFQILVHLGADIGTGGETCVVGVDYKTVDDVVAKREVVLGLVVAAVEGSTVLLLERCTGHLLLPVDFLALAIITRIPNLVDEHIIALGDADSLGIGVEVEYVKRVRQSLDTPVSGQGNVGVTLRTVLGGNHDNAVGTSRTVDGGSGGILQDLDALDVGGVHEVGIVAYLHTINYIKRRSIAIDGTDTTDADSSLSVRRTVLHGNLHTGSSTLEGLTNVLWYALHHGSLVNSSH